MKLALILTILLLGGFTTALNANGFSSLDEGTAAKACLDDPPPSTDTFMTSLCEGFAGIEAEEHAHRQAWAKIDAMGCDAVCRHPIDKAREDREAIEVGKVWAAQWARSVRSVRPTRIPSIEELDSELVMLEAGMLSPFSSVPIMREPLHCTSYSLGMFVNMDCY